MLFKHYAACKVNSIIIHVLSVLSLCALN